MRKLLLFLFALLMGVSGAWAIDVTIIKSTVSQTTYGGLSDGTFTTNGTSGLSGVTVSGISNLQNTSFAYGSSLGFASTASGTITVTVPDGYKIIGYSLFARSNTYSVPYTLTPTAGGSAVTTSTGGVMLTTHGIESKTTSITYSAASANSFYIPQLVLSVKADAAETVDVVYKEVWDGEVKETHETVSQVVGETPNLWEYYRNKAYCTSYKYYSTQDCSGEELTSLTSSSTTVFVKPVFNPPFTLSSGFDGATWYYVYFNRSAGKRYWEMNPNSTPYPDQTSKPSVSEAIWAFTGNPYDGIKVMNARAGDGYYLKKKGTNNGDAITMQADGQSWAIGVGNTGFFLKEDGTNVFIHDYSSKLAVWNSSGAATDLGSAIVVEDAAPIKVTYKLTYNGNVISSYTKDLYELVGATAAAPFNWVLPPYCSTGTCTPATIEAGTTEVNVELVWDGPFEIASDYASAAWHYVNIGGAWTIYNGSALAATDSRKAAIEAGDGALWAFVGNPTSFKMYNKALGSTYKLNVGNNLVMSTSDTYAPLTITKVSATTFYLANDGSYYLGYDETKDNKFPYVSPADSRALMTAISEYCGKAINDVYTWAATQPVDNTPFSINSSCLTTIENNFANMMPKMNQSEYEALSIPTDITASLVYVYPTTGYFRIKSSGTRSIGDSYIGYGSSDYGTGLRTVVAANKLTDISTVIKLDGSAGTYKLSTEGLNVQSQTEANAAFTATGAEGVDFVFTVSSPGVVTIRNAASASGERQGDLHEGQDGSTVKGVINWQASADQSKWTVEEASSIDITLMQNIGGKSYATVYLPFPVSEVSGAKAYKLSVTKTYASAAEIEGGFPAGTGVLLVSDDNNATATLTIGGTPAEVTENALTGHNAKGNVENAYIFAYVNGVLGFYPLDGTQEVAANKAYILSSSIPNEVRGLTLEFGDVDRIETLKNVENETMRNAIYNIAGQRVAKTQKGIYIVNGKKVVIK